MIGRTLGFYFARIFFLWIIGLFIATSILVFLIDFLEVVRSNANSPGFSLLTLAGVSGFRVPLIIEQVLPFAVLLGALATFIDLSRRIELVVGRAAGLSVWQFALPGVLVAFLVGAVATTVYNPLAVDLRRISDRISATALGDRSILLSQTGDSSWVRQKTSFGHSILHVGNVSADGTLLVQPTLWEFDLSGHLIRRLDASSARLDGAIWHLSDAVIASAADGIVRHQDKLDVETQMTAAQIRETLGSPDTVSFWDLPETIERASNAGLPAYRFRLVYQQHLALPMLLVAMICIAASVGLGVSRSGGTGWRILGGVLAGFMLYVVSKVTSDLGAAGLVSPVTAAWSPVYIAIMSGVTILLYREDG